MVQGQVFLILFLFNLFKVYHFYIQKLLYPLQICVVRKWGEFVRRTEFVLIQNFAFKLKFPRTTIDPTLFLLTNVNNFPENKAYSFYISYLAHAQFLWIVQIPKFTNPLYSVRCPLANEQSSIMRNKIHNLHKNYFGSVSLFYPISFDT